MAFSFTKNNGVFLHQAQRDQIVVYLKSPSPEKQKQWRFPSTSPARVAGLVAVA